MASPQNPGLPEWYPGGVVYDPFVDPNAYGPARQETLRLFASLEPGSRILDLAGGYGRYAEPLANAGHHVTVLDIDPTHLAEAKRRGATLSPGTGSIQTIQADILAYDPSAELEPFDGGLCAGFIYLAPEDVVREVFKRYASCIRRGGLVATEFATERDRRTADDEPLVGPNEKNYSLAAGELLMRQVYRENGCGEPNIATATIRQVKPYILRTELLIASGQRQV